MLLRPGFLGVGVQPLELVSEVAISSPSTALGTISNVDVGAGFNTRRIVYILAGGHFNGNHPDSVTIGGVSATEIGSITPGTGISHVGIWMANVPTGTSISIVRHGTGSGDQRYVHRVYVLRGGDLNNTTITEETDSSTPYTQSINIPANSLTIGGFGAVRIGNSIPTYASHSWTNLTEKEDAVTNITSDGTNVRYGGSIASRFDTTSAGSVSITATPNLATHNSNGMCIVNIS